ncbi:hypothetical protein [Sediminibacter sp. Hel_I_10]|uniref:hypothetical protein n=1 Tax=Sediminibacter sp. Hel_I_10 TaxID=1392490 RepID=UPI00047E62E1|nr:hypothetical protein [Sediminibacter sp. Hel_I_10]
MRECDPMGCGHFGAKRGNYKHNGVDLIKSHNDDIYAPFDCKINRFGKPYANDSNYDLVEIVGLGEWSDFRVKLMYVYPMFSVGATILKGQKLCTAQDIELKYGYNSGMQTIFILNFIKKINLLILKII